MVEEPGNAVMTGPILSSTIIVWLAVVMLPQRSTAVQVRVTERSFGQAPGVVVSAEVKSTAPPQASVAVGVAN